MREGERREEVKKIEYWYLGNVSLFLNIIVYKLKILFCFFCIF